MLLKASPPALFLAEEWSSCYSHNLHQEVCVEMGTEERGLVMSQKIISLSRSNSSSSSKHDSQKVMGCVCVCARSFAAGLFRFMGTIKDGHNKTDWKSRVEHIISTIKKKKPACVIGVYSELPTLINFSLSPTVFPLEIKIMMFPLSCAHSSHPHPALSTKTRVSHE